MKTKLMITGALVMGMMSLVSCKKAGKIAKAVYEASKESKPYIQGTYAISQKAPHDCAYCNGEGVFALVDYDGAVYYNYDGTIATVECEHCNGTGLYFPN